MRDFLHKMATASRDRAAFVNREFSDDELDRPLVPLELERFDIIAEIKDNSPAEGQLAAPGDDREQRARDYAEGGAAAISVLTEPFRFAGEIGHLEAVVRAVDGLGVPVMRKDFLVDTAQILEARAAGASGLLLIAAILDDDELADMLACAREHSLFVLLEVFDEADLERCCALLADSAHAKAAEERKLLLGVNSRDLRTLNVDAERFADYAARLPEGVVTVAESGLCSAEDVARIAKNGYSMALIGSALMRSDEPRALLAEMLAAGRGA